MQMAGVNCRLWTLGASPFSRMQRGMRPTLLVLWMTPANLQLWEETISVSWDTAVLICVIQLYWFFSCSYIIAILLTVLSAQMVDPANASDIVFPSGPQDLANFTDGDMGTTATISIPTEAIGIFSGGRNGTSVNFHFSISVVLFEELFFFPVLYSCASSTYTLQKYWAIPSFQHNRAQVGH